MKNLPCVTIIVNSWKGNGILVSNYRDTVNQDSVADKLMSIAEII